MTEEQARDGESRTYPIYASLEGYESHFNNIQAGIRGLASVWLLSSLGAIAYLLRLDSGRPSFLLAANFGVSVVCLLGAIGLAILWNLDQLVYQGFLNAVFVLALKMEYEDRSLPPIRTLMALNARHGHGIRQRVQLFYLFPIYILAVISTASLFIRFGVSGRFGPVAPLISTGAWTTAVTVSWISRRSRQAPVDRAADFGDPAFLEYMKTLKQSARVTLERFCPAATDPPPLTDDPAFRSERRSRLINRVIHGLFGNGREASVR